MSDKVNEDYGTTPSTVTTVENKKVSPTSDGTKIPSNVLEGTEMGAFSYCDKHYELTFD